MPYWRHVKDTAPDSGTAYPSMAEARQGLPKTETVTFVATPDEIDTWQSREKTRFYTGDYLSVPWIADPRLVYYSADFPPAVRNHFPHRSLNNPDLIAYTKNDEHGVNDRQTAIKPGRYLQEFFDGYFTPEQVADYIARCKASTQELKIARSTADIVAIYSKIDCGFTSCMQHKRDPEYAWQRAVERGDRPHPCAVYGDSDLGVAYLGDLNGRVLARAVVWPDRQLYTRAYGDTTLTAILKAHGYTQGGLDGARVRYVTSGGHVVMPYIDGIDTASLVRNGVSTPEWIVLGDHGRIQCGHVSGYGDDAEDGDENAEPDEYYDECTCEHCEATYDYDSQSNGELNRRWCDDCLSSRETCDLCAFSGWDCETVGALTVCSVCWETHGRDCSAEHIATRTHEENDSLVGAGGVYQCDAQWLESHEFSPYERADRLARHVETRCRACAEGVQTCVQCAAVFDAELSACATCGRAVRCAHTLPLPSETEPLPMIGPSPIDGSRWWQRAPHARPEISGYWIKFPGMGYSDGWFCDRVDALALTADCAVGSASHFNTLDDSPGFRRCVDPRLSRAAVSRVNAILLAPVEECPF